VAKVALGYDADTAKSLEDAAQALEDQAARIEAARHGCRRGRRRIGRMTPAVYCGFSMNSMVMPSGSRR
jgi:hypothetical protein